MGRFDFRGGRQLQLHSARKHLARTFRGEILPGTTSKTLSTVPLRLRIRAIAQLNRPDYRGGFSILVTPPSCAYRRGYR